jgi:hypothetical protein
MENLMNNSFYYFFSATPQVLGAIMAMFGVLIMFKTQSIKDTLFGYGQTLIFEIEEINNTIQSKRIILSKKRNNTEFIKNLKKFMYEKNLQFIYASMIELEKENFAVGKYIFDGFEQEVKRLEKIIRNTIQYSIMSLCIIAFSLCIIPFYSLINNHPLLLLGSYVIVISGIIGSCIFYYEILINTFSLSDIVK